MRVVDVGNAMCVVIRAPGGGTMVYDTGERYGTECTEAVAEIIGSEPIDLIVLSHSDSDHIGELAPILDGHRAGVTRLVYTGHARTTDIYRRDAEAMARAQQRGLIIHSLATDPLPNVPVCVRTSCSPQGQPMRLKLGEAMVTFVAGWHAWPNAGPYAPIHDESELRNVISIVVRIEYGGHSILLSGDTIGRPHGRDPNECAGAEKWMVRNGNVSLDADVIVGQHHGGDNSSAACFIRAVSPSYVIFPSGHSRNQHPRASAVQRFLDHGVRPENIFRTDRGDQDIYPDRQDVEWREGRVANCRDRVGDDDVEVVLPARAALQVRYRVLSPVC